MMSKLGIYLLVAIIVTATNASLFSGLESYINYDLLPEITFLINRFKIQSNDADLLLENLQSSFNKFSNDFLVIFRKYFLEVVYEVDAIIETYLMEAGVKINVSECTQLVVLFAETLNHVEDNLRECIKNELKIGTERRNSIVDVVDNNIDILEETKDKVLRCLKNYKDYHTTVKCLVDAKADAYATEPELYNIIGSYITHLNLSVVMDFRDCKSKSRFPKILKQKINVVHQCEQCIKKMLNESLTGNVNAETFETDTEIFDGFDTIYPTTFVQKIVDMSITPTINQINKLLIETKKSLDKLQESTIKYENTFYNDTDMILQTSRQKVDDIKKTVRTQSEIDVTECDEFFEIIVEEASYVKNKFTNCINKNFTTAAAYYQRIIEAIRDLRGYLNVLKNQALIRRGKSDSYVEYVGKIVLEANIFAGEYIEAISMMINKMEFSVASIESSFRGCKKEKKLESLKDQILHEVSRCVQ